MTYVYGSTPYGRKDAMNEAIVDNFGANIPYMHRMEFANLIDKFFVYRMHAIEGMNLVETLLLNLVKLNKDISFKNKYFTITLAPKGTIKKQVQCITYQKNVRAAQLVVQHMTSETNKTKLLSSAGANIIHSMDAVIIHKFFKLIKIINTQLRKSGSFYQFTYYTVHDCVYFNYPVALKAILHDCYLDLAHEDYLSYFPKEVQNLASMGVQEFCNLLENINPNFVK